MSKKFGKHKITVITASVIMIILGIILIFNPIDVTVFICRVAGFLLLVSGIFTTGSYFLNSAEDIGDSSIVMGLIQLALGLWITLRSENFVQFLTMIIGFVVLVHSFGFFGNTIDIRRCGYKYWWVMLIVSVITLILGILIVVAPFKTVAVTMIVSGIGLIFDGITGIVAVIKVDKFVRDVRAAVNENVIETSGEEIK